MARWWGAAGCLPAQGVGETNADIYDRTDGVTELDASALVNFPYYDVTGTHQRDDTSLAIYNAPRVEVSAATPKCSLTTAADHLLVRGRVE